jgi:hypothetical protein
MDLIPGTVNLKEDYARAWRPFQDEILEAAANCDEDPADREVDSF